MNIDWQNWLVALRQNSNAVGELISKSEDWRDLRGSGPFAGMTTVMLVAKGAQPVADLLPYIVAQVAGGLAALELYKRVKA